MSKRLSIKEAVNSSELPTLLRNGLQGLMFSEYNMTPALYPSLVNVSPSDNEREYIIEQARQGTFPIVGEGAPYPEVATPGLYPERSIVNAKRGAIFGLTEEMIRFDKLGYVVDQVTDFGQSAKETIEDAVFSVFATAGNYTLNSTTGDNDVGANTQTLRFSAHGLETAWAVLTTMKDQRSGKYLGIVPDTIIYGPRLWFPVKQLLNSPSITLGGEGLQTGAGTVLFGQGTVNAFADLIPNRFMSPKLGAYEWILTTAKKAVKMFEVEPLQLLNEEIGSSSHGGYILYDKIRYRARVWFGVGMWNQKYAFFSDDTTGPEIR